MPPLEALVGVWRVSAWLAGLSEPVEGAGDEALALVPGMGNWKPLVFLFASAASAAFFASGSASECLRAWPLPAAPPPLPPRGVLFSPRFWPAGKLKSPALPNPDAPLEGAGGGPMPMLGIADWLRRWPPGAPIPPVIGTPICC